MPHKAARKPSDDAVAQEQEANSASARRAAFEAFARRRKSAAPFEKRAEELSLRRQFKMARSAQAFVRGSTRHFYRWLEEQRDITLPEGPSVWICGDCHYGNFGPIGAQDGGVSIGLRDFDQAVVGNPAHDLIRLALSLATAIRDCNLSGVTIIDMVEAMCLAYEETLSPKEESCETPACVAGALRAAYRRNWEKLARERVDGPKWYFPRGKRFWPLTPDEVDAVQLLCTDPRMLKVALNLNKEGGNAVSFEDAAYWVKGCSSLGLLRISVLLRVKTKGAASWRLIDIKEAVKAMAPRQRSAPLPEREAERVVSAARALSPALGARMAAETLLDKSVFVRELMPQDLKLEIWSLDADEAVRAARYLAIVLGRAHAQQMSEDDRRAWGRELSRGRTLDVEAPNWLWRAVVSLLATHQGAYLEHCRNIARVQIPPVTEGAVTPAPSA